MIFELQITNVPDLEQLRSILAGAGITAVDLAEIDQPGDLPALAIYRESSAETRRLRAAFRKIIPVECGLILRELKVADWRDKWKEDFQAFQLSSRFDVVPAWDTKYLPTPRMPIRMDTSLAFGTGLHETTRFMVKLLEGVIEQVDSFFDIGAGTGILAIAASFLGVKLVEAVEIDPDAVKVARQNFRRNKLSVPRIFRQDIGKCLRHKQYDYVAANLITPDLMRLSDKIVSFVAPGKYLALSGISLENYDLIRKHFSKYPFHYVKAVKGKEWVALLCRRTADNRRWTGELR
ncbi:MAG: 50S ribosomal protein L11 methyltransferase [Candidatus Omnitrophica bacterium]|nr:50S ribosomal protein L11 methyltransferase [Candidatus Omnitrophota bacterium]